MLRELAERGIAAHFATANLLGREFVGAVVKTLPRPRAIECAKEYLGLRKHVRLTFVCARGAGEPFVVEVCHGVSRYATVCHGMSWYVMVCHGMSR